MKKNYGYSASLILALTTLGYLTSLIFDKYFIGRLFSAMCYSAMIGGIADWFGITALFRKPLGIPFKTEIIPRNREKLVESIIYMVEHELLSKEAIQRKLTSYCPSQRLLELTKNPEVITEVSKIVENVLEGLLDKNTWEKSSDIINESIYKISSGIDISPAIFNSAQFTIKQGFDKKTTDFVSGQLQNILKHRQVENILSSIFENTFDKLKEASNTETGGKKIILKLVFTFASLTGMGPTKLANRIKNKSIEYLDKLKDQDSIEYNKLILFLNDYLEKSKQNDDLKSAINASFMTFINRQDFMEMLEGLTESLSNSEKTTENDKMNLSKISMTLVEMLVEKFNENPVWQLQFDTFIKEKASELIEKNQHMIGQLVHSKLDSFSNDFIVDFVESRAGNDLQIIRINGSIVGGLVGTAIFLLTLL